MFGNKARLNFREWACGVAAKWTCPIAACLLVTIAPAAAQNSDPFQSAPVATPAPAPKPRPQPRPATGPDPYAAAPPPAAAAPPVASLPPTGAIWARVRQVAAASGISVPLASDPPFDASTASPQSRVLVGAWGPGVWQDDSSDRLILIVLAADGGTSVRGVVARGIAWSPFSAAMAGNGFTIHVQTTYQANGAVTNTRTAEDDNWRFELRPDGLYGSRASNAATIVLPKLQ